MDIKRCKKESFVVIGKEGSTADGQGFIQNLWKEATEHFAEVKSLAKKEEKGNFLGFWGAMSDVSRSFKPWEDNFTKGLYLAGAECNDDAEAPEGWTKWKVPGYEYLYVENDGPDTFPNMIQYLKDNNIALAGAVHDFTCPCDGKNYMFFPINKI
ncbi:MAG TPA: AraC family transcriptional regulator [Clostridium sp.]|nr:AraC family transcriptional regulator [Clostridium sp.]